eukprot:347908_1
MSAKSSKIYQGFKEGTYVSRKGRLCIIKRIHFEMHPPSVTVHMIDNNCDVGTEFNRLKPINAWYCSMCTAKNPNICANKCAFCNINRKYNEKLSVSHNNEIRSLKEEQTQQKIENSSANDGMDGEVGNKCNTQQEIQTDHMEQTSNKHQ